MCTIHIFANPVTIAVILVNSTQSIPSIGTIVLVRKLWDFLEKQTINPIHASIDFVQEYSAWVYIAMSYLTILVLLLYL